MSCEGENHAVQENEDINEKKTKIKLKNAKKKFVLRSVLAFTNKERKTYMIFCV